MCADLLWQQQRTNAEKPEGNEFRRETVLLRSFDGSTEMLRNLEGSQENLLSRSNYGLVIG